MSNINLKFNVAIAIHIYDISLLEFFSEYYKKFIKKYNMSYFDIFINIVNTPKNTKENIKAELSRLKFNVTSVLYSINKGGDIGGFYLLINYIKLYNKEYDYVAFLHGKKNKKWRSELTEYIFKFNWEYLPSACDIMAPGILTYNKWIYNFKEKDFKMYKYHLIKLCEIYKININTLKSTKFVAGTMFIANIKIINFIHEKSEQVYYFLNYPNSIDINWLYIINKYFPNINRKNCHNDYQYRLLYNKSILSDYMIEHTIERFIGIICFHLEFSLK